MKIIFILIIIVLSSIVYAEQETFTTDFLIKLHDNIIDIDTESSDYSYNCIINGTTEYNKTITIHRNVEKSGCTSEISSLAKTCNETITVIRDDLKDHKSFSTLYTECVNSKENFISKDTFTECTKKQSELNDKVNSLNNEKSIVSSQYSACESARTTLENEKKTKQPDYIKYGIAGIIGGGIVWWIFIGRHRLKGRKETLFGSSQNFAERGRE